MENPYNKMSYKIIRKLCGFIKVDYFSLSTNYLLKHIPNEYENIPFDIVYGVSGLFCYSNVAYEFAKKHAYRLRLIHFDPFINPRLQNTINRRRYYENNWLQYAEMLFFDTDNHHPDNIGYKDKIIPFRIPIEVRSISKDFGSYYLYGGIFYEKIRNPSLLLDFCKENIDIDVQCYSNYKADCTLTNLQLNPLIDHDVFVEKCKNAAGLIYIGNTGIKSVSSKYLEYIGMRKPIIGINVEKVNDVRKYPFFVDVNEKGWKDKLRIISKKELEQYNPYFDYPDRNPNDTFKLFFQ